MLKKLFSLILSSIIFMSVSVTSFASDLKYESNNQSINSSIAEKYNITEDEIVNLNDNLKNALNVLNSKRIINEPNSNGVIEETIPVSENLILTITTKEIPSNNSRASVYTRTITSTMSLKNIFGVTIVTLNSIGIFETNGYTSKPVDAYGTHESFVWSVANTNSTKGSSAYNSWVRNNFSGQFDLGIDPVSVTIQSFSYSCTIYCNANGFYSVNWV